MVRRQRLGAGHRRWEGEVLTGLSMRRLLRRHLAEGKMVSGHSRDQNNCRKRGVERGVCSTSKPEGIWLLLGLCDGLFADGERGSGDICGCGHCGRRKREGAIRGALKYHGLTQPYGGVPLPVPCAYMAQSIHLFSPFYVTHHTRFIALARISPLKSATLSVHIFLRYRRYHTTFHFAWTRHQLSVNTIRASISAKS